MRKTSLIPAILLLAALFPARQTAAAPAPLKFTGRLAISHDGNIRDNDDWAATALNWGVIAAFGAQSRLVHLDHCNILEYSSTSASMENNQHLSAQGWKYFPGFDGSVVFCDQTQLAAALANFGKQADASTAADPLTLICAGRMEVPWRLLNAAARDKRKYITCISHSTANDNFTYGTQMTHTWDDLKDSFGGDGVTFVHISDQNKYLGRGANWDFLKSMPDHTCIPAAAWKWVYDREEVVNTGDASDAGMTWYVLTGGDQNGTPAKFEERFKDPIPQTTGIQNAKPFVFAQGTSRMQNAEFSALPNPMSAAHFGHWHSAIGNNQIYNLLGRTVTAGAQVRPGTYTILYDHGAGKLVVVE